MKKYGINKARLMRRAWQIAKTLTGDIAARLSLVPNLTGWQDRRKEVMVMSTVSGVNTTAFFKKFWNTGAFVLHDDMMMAGEAAVKVLQLIPDPCLMWAILRAR